MRQHHTPMMNASADRRLEEQAQLLGFALSEPIKIGGQYTPVLRDGDSLYVSGQIPRVGDVITAVGCVGDTTPAAARA